MLNLYNRSVFSLVTATVRATRAVWAARTMRATRTTVRAIVVTCCVAWRRRREAIVTVVVDQRIQVLVPKRVNYVRVVVVQGIEMRRITWTVVSMKGIATLRYKTAGRSSALKELIFLASVYHHDRHERCKKQEFLHKDFKVKIESNFCASKLAILSIRRLS
jgi:hypothetical protein